MEAEEVKKFRWVPHELLQPPTGDFVSCEGGGEGGVGGLRQYMNTAKSESHEIEHNKVFCLGLFSLQTKY